MNLIEYVALNVIQEQYGLKANKGYRSQTEQHLERQVFTGNLTISDFFTRKGEAQQESLSGVDDGHSCTKGQCEV